jgi:folylpolyglutamate synthase/dihydropteroate synthase
LDPLSYLFSLEQFGIKFGLDNIRALLARLGNPQRAFRSIHIAGTNGKGSTIAYLRAILEAAGLRDSEESEVVGGPFLAERTGDLPFASARLRLPE